MFEEFSRPLKVTLSVLFVALLAVLVLVVLTQRGLLGKKTSTIKAPTTTSQSPTELPTVVYRVSPGESAPSIFLAPPVSVEDVQKYIKALQDQVNAGTLSSEDAKKQIDILNAQVDSPQPSPEMQKQIDEMKKVQP